MPNPNSSMRRFCVAPMMAWTDRHCRRFHRLLTSRALLYTEMVTAAAIIHGDRDRLLAFDGREHPLALQLGGAEPDDLARACEIASPYGYREINLNVGCPSDRVQSGRFGACLMAEPDLVAKCIAAMQRSCDVPVTVKCRIGIDDHDSAVALSGFVETVAAAGCSTFVLHARKAWLKGLSPKQNREIPPLDYDRVYGLKAAMPGLEIVINGGITSLADAERRLRQVDGVMLGRAAYHTPYLLAQVDQRFFGASRPVLSRREVMEGLCTYIEEQQADAVRLNQITRHCIGLYHGLPGARAFRRILSEEAGRPGAGVEVLKAALAAVETSTIRQAAE